MIALDPGVSAAIHTYARIRRWGTCVECPETDGVKYPEFCPHTNRYDHQSNGEKLIDMVRRYEGKS